MALRRSSQALRVVSNEPTLPKSPRPRAVFSAEQRARLATVLRNLHRPYGTYDRVAEAIGMSKQAIENALYSKGGSMMLAVRAAHVAGIPVETITNGTVLLAGRCAHCGQELPCK